MKESHAKIFVYTVGILTIVLTVYFVYLALNNNSTDDAIDAILVGGFILLVIIGGIWSMKRDKEIKATGLRVEADLVGVEKVKNEKDKMEYIVVAKGRDIKTGEETEYYSEPLNANPEKYLPAKLTILVNPKDTQDYIMDLDFLNKIIPEEANDPEYQYKKYFR